LVDWRAHPERRVPAAEGELADTTTSPNKLKDQHLYDSDKNAKKRLAFEKSIPAGDTSQTYL
jgi:hypothetical protein